MHLDLSFLDEEVEWTREMQTFVEYFVKNTTEKVFRRMQLMGVDSPAIKASIHGVIYNNSGGNAALVRFYYLNIARFIELGVGHNFMSDYDLGLHTGVKVTNVDIPELQSGNYAPLKPTIKGIPAKGARKDRKTGHVTTGIDRAEFHKAKPFLMNTIRQELRRIAERMALEFCFTHTWYVSQGLNATLAQEQADEVWRKNMGLLEDFRIEMNAQMKAEHH